MAQWVVFDRPVLGQEPADSLTTFVFMLNLASQEATGVVAASVSVDQVLARLRGSTVSDAVLAGLVVDDSPGTTFISAPSTVPTRGANTHDTFQDFSGFVLLGLSLLEERHITDVEFVLDAQYLPLPGAPVEAATRRVFTELVTGAEHLARRHGRTVLQTTLGHSADESAGDTPLGGLMAEHGFSLRHTETHGVLDELPSTAPPLPTGLRVHIIHDYAVPPMYVDDITDLLALASIDIPHGTLTTEPARWTPQRLIDAAARLHDRGGAHLLAILVDDSGRTVALTEFHHHPGALAEVAEQGVTIVARDARRRGAGRAVTQWGLVAVDKYWPEVRTVYSSHGSDNLALAAIAATVGRRTVSGSSAWEKDITHEHKY